MFRAMLVVILLCVAIAPTFQAAVPDSLNDRIIGGSGAMINKFPYIVSFQRNDVHQCGGSILNENTILTAAHCVDAFEKQHARDISIRAGATIWSAGGQHIRVKKMIKHPKYDVETNNYDYALLILSSPLEFDVTVQPIKLADKVPGDNRDCLVSGWGLKKEKAYMVSTMLQQAEVKSISRERCSSNSYGYNKDITDTMVCANNPGIDTCQGDSGGPYVCKNLVTKEYELVGVTSFGRGCGRPDFPGVYSLVAAVRKWIAKNIEMYTSISVSK